LKQNRGKKVIEGSMMQKISNFLHPPTKHDHEVVLRCGAPFCHAGLTMVQCAANGDIYPCGCSAILPECRLGNVYQESFPDYQRVMDNFLEVQAHFIRKCEDCESRVICEFSCPAFYMRETGTADQVCRANRVLSKQFNDTPRALLEEIERNANPQWSKQRV
jgi:radical SAM protein with 4Fe4S-binding SPASM domain